MYKPCMPSVVSMFLHLRTTSSATPLHPRTPSKHAHTLAHANTHTQSLSQKLHFSKNQTIKKVAFLNPPAGCALISDSLRTTERQWCKLFACFTITSHVNYNDGGPRKISADKKQHAYVSVNPREQQPVKQNSFHFHAFFSLCLKKKTKFQVKFSIRMAAWSIVL